MLRFNRLLLVFLISSCVYPRINHEGVVTAVEFNGNSDSYKRDVPRYKVTIDFKAESYFVLYTDSLYSIGDKVIITKKK